MVKLLCERLAVAPARKLLEHVPILVALRVHVHIPEGLSPAQVAHRAVGEAELHQI